VMFVEKFGVAHEVHHQNPYEEEFAVVAGAESQFGPGGLGDAYA
jgi:hypothetical protein